MRKFLVFLLCVFLTISLPLPLSGCAQGSILAYQSLSGEYKIRYLGPAGEVSCTLSLSEGDITRDFRLSFGKSEGAPAYTIAKIDGVFWLEFEKNRVSVSPPPICEDILSLFSIPEGARVCTLTKEGDTRAVTLQAEDTFYTLHFAGKSEIPCYISAENTRFVSIYVN